MFKKRKLLKRLKKIDIQELTVYKCKQIQEILEKLHRSNLIKKNGYRKAVLKTIKEMENNRK